MKQFKTNGKVVSEYLKLQSQLYDEVGKKVANIDALYFPVDSLAVDTAYKVCRYCFNKQRENKMEPCEDEFDEYSNAAIKDAMKFSFLFFRHILSVYLGLDKER